MIRFIWFGCQQNASTWDVLSPNLSEGTMLETNCIYYEQRICLHITWIMCYAFFSHEILPDRRKPAHKVHQDVVKPPPSSCTSYSYEWCAVPAVNACRSTYVRNRGCSCHPSGNADLRSRIHCLEVLRRCRVNGILSFLPQNCTSGLLVRLE